MYIILIVENEKEYIFLSLKNMAKLTIMKFLSTNNKIIRRL